MIKLVINFEVVLPDHSSVGRAVDCRSIGHLFESGWSDTRSNEVG